MSLAFADAQGNAPWRPVGVGGRPWRLASADDDRVADIIRRTGCPDLTARILALRGFDADAAVGVLRPRLKDLMPDPGVLTAMDEAAERIARAVASGERIAVFADYDADGLTAGAVVVDFLRAAGVTPITYVPDRLTEGYGPTPAAMRALREAGADLAVMVDCGANAFDALDAAAEAGLAVVVFDHHPVARRYEGKASIVNPQRADDASGLDHLSAGGVALMGCIAAARALKAAGRTLAAYDPFASLDLVAIGAICDLVPLIGLNRAFAAQGLKVLARGARPGLKALCAQAGLDAPFDPQDVGFGIGPRLNAAGRMGRAGAGLALLLAEDAAGAAHRAAELEALNRDRRAAQRAMAAEAVRDGEEQSGSPAVLVGRTGWSAGLAGLAASKLVERFGRPALVVGFDDDGPQAVGRGSGRSVPGVDLGALVRRAQSEGLLASGGGHAMAVGVAVRRDRWSDFMAFMAAHTPSPAPPEPLSAAFRFSPGGARSARDAIRRLEPFGAGFHEPFGVMRGVRLSVAEAFGADHMRFRFQDGGGASLHGVAFGVAGERLGAAALEAQGREVDALGVLTDDPYRGVGFRVTDLALTPS